MKVNSVLCLVALCALAVPAVCQQQVGPSSQPPQIVTPGGPNSTSMDGLGVKKYLLGPGDVLDLRVYGHSDFSGALVVNDEGNVEIPFVDDPIPATCRTDREIKRDVEKALSKYLKKPQISLRVAEMRSRPPAVVFGAVRAPQRVQMQRKARLLELLAFSGGVTEQAGSLIQIFHTEPLMCPDPEDLAVVQKPVATLQATDATQVPFELYSLAELKLGKPEANPQIRPGDIVIVQETAPIYITGAVVSPQGVYLRDTKMPLSRAIAMVGGLRKEAKTSAVKIYRIKEGTQEQEQLIVNFSEIKKGKAEDIALKPYDVIEVPDGSGGLGPTLKGLLTGLVMNVPTVMGQQLPMRVLY
jgi:polysaccharide export outer membrane protein